MIDPTSLTGNSVQGQTAYDGQNGVLHSHSRHDATGNMIACPSR